MSVVNRRRAGAVAVLTALALVVPLAGPATPAAADPAGDVFAVQMRLIAAADRISSAMAGTTGLAGLTVEADVPELRLYWKGPVPARVQLAILAERPTRVTVFPARYSQVELTDAGLPILDEPGVTAVAPEYDGSALEVAVSGDAEPARQLPAIQNAAVPVVIQPHVAPVYAVGRQADTSPYSGGSTYHFPLGSGVTGLCTTGFAVSIGGVHKVLSAGHCRDDGDTVYENSAGPTVEGTVSGTDKGHDTLLIEADSVGQVYNGPFTSTTSRRVLTNIKNYPHTLVCGSGGVTGQHCDIRIQSVGVVIKVETYEGSGVYQTIFGEVWAEQEASGVAAGEGDSGGPVVAQDTYGDFLNAYPLGTVTAIDTGNKVACGGTLFPTVCSWRVFYADVNAALLRYGASIVT
ncbi:MAG TPA: hypothetical protein VKB69_04435 [Micromonosporaceae bacterium]|nr:hypothetical protein [Micromonosporaceae bacterium]